MKVSLSATKKGKHFVAYEPDVKSDLNTDLFCGRFTPAALHCRVVGNILGRHSFRYMHDARERTVWASDRGI